MSKAENFIQKNTRDDSNICFDASLGYINWLTPDQARKAVEIAREEIYEWLEENAAKSLIHYLKQAMEDE